jgi:outer membrane protein OmpA-like peptidoglycan-associated protein
MLRTLTYTTILFLLWAFFARWYYTCYIKAVCCEDTGIETRISGLRLTKNGTGDILPQLDAFGKTPRYDQFFFKHNNEQPDLNANNQAFLQKTADYLKANPSEKMTLLCCHRPSETEELAQKRAEYLKQQLVQLGVQAAQITTSVCKDNEKLLTPAYFEINATNNAKENTQIAAKPAESVLNFSIADENFAYNSKKFEPGENFIARANELKKYVLSHPDVSLTIIGHTDNIGSDAANIRLGKLRAEAVKNYLTSSIGIKAKINTVSKGEAEPIAENDTEAGRARNRRVNCKVNQ